MDQAPQSPLTAPSFDTPIRRGSSGASKNMWIIVGILGIVALVVVGWILASRFTKSSDESQPSSSPEVFAEFATPSPSAEGTSTESADKTKLTIEVLNGTGIAKEASLLEEKLKKIGYETIEAGNADAKTHDTAQVTFYPSFPESLKKELLQLLDDTYTNVEEKKATGESSVDVRIITGLRPGVTRPSATPKPTSVAGGASPTPSPSPSPTPSPTD